MKKRTVILYLLLAALIAAGALIFVKRDCTQAGLETSRLAVIQSVVDNGTFDITGSIFKTSDKAFIDGKYYGDKPPLLTFLSMGEYFILAKIAGVTFSNHYHLVIFLLYLPYFLAGCGCGFLFYRILNRYIKNSSTEKFRIAAAFLSVISTLVFSYSVTIGNHVPVALMLLWLILQLENTQKSQYSVKNLLWCGVIAGLIFNCEFVIGGAFAAGIFFFVLTAPAENLRIRIKRAAVYSVGVLLLIALEGVMNYISHKSPLPLYLLTHKPDMAEKDYLYYAWNILFGFEGFFLYMPACFLLFFALRYKFPGKNRVCRYMLGSMLAATAVFIAATSDYGGFCYGYRFMVPFAPVMLLYVFLSFHTVRKRSWCNIIFGIALAWGIVTSAVGTLNPWNSGYEGSLTGEGNFNRNVRNGFLGNLYVFSYEHLPESELTRIFIEDIYGAETAMLYLCEEFLNRNQVEKVQPACRYFVEKYSAEK